MRIFYCILIVSLSFYLSACSNVAIDAPVSDVTTIEPIPAAGSYRVQEDDTLYSIAWRYGLDYRYLAKRNHIALPYHIEPGQVIYLRGQARSQVAANQVTGVPVIEKEPTALVATWRWPAQGVVTHRFSSMNKGINISGARGTPIVAAAPGKVVYSGNGLRAYGNLIIIKHNSLFLSAYAHCEHVTVKEGQWVKAAEQIAEMGKSGSRKVMLHFEIRRSGEPVNPLSYLARH